MSSHKNKSPKSTKLSLRNSTKRNNEDKSDEDSSPIKRNKAEGEDVSQERKENFIKACNYVSYQAYRNVKKRFQLLYLPDCINTCIHNQKTGINKISSKAEKSFKSEMANNSWGEALEVCFVSITPKQYLSANMMKDVVEIIMNANEDLSTDYTIPYLLQRCQQALALQFNMHPPCEQNIRQSYLEFLTSPMDPKLDTSTNRAEYSSKDGIVAYCFNRLLNEISADSKDEGLVDKKAIPKEFEDSVKSLHWIKQNQEIFELLKRTDRIERIMVVLETLIDLLQCDMAIFLSRRSRQRRSPTLMSSILMPNSKIVITELCQNIIKVFVYFIHLQYPDQHIKTMTLWVNTLTEAYYMSDSDSNNDYPNVNTRTSALAKNFYQVLTTVPSQSASRVLEMIQPPFMQHLVGLSYIKISFNMTYKACTNDILSIMVAYINNFSWDDYPEQRKFDLLRRYKESSRTIRGSLSEYLSKKCKRYQSLLQANPTETVTNPYPKLTNSPDQPETPEVVIEMLYITLIAYLEAYSVKDLLRTVNSLNEKFETEKVLEYTEDGNTISSYFANHGFIRAYRNIVKNLQKLEEDLSAINCVDGPIKTILNIIHNYK